MFQSIFDALNKQKVRYLVIGGVAVNLHGYSRNTGDLDILIDLTTANIQKFLKAIQNLGLKPTAPLNPIDLLDPAKRRRWIKEKNMKALSFYDPSEPILSLDILIDSKLDFDLAYKHKKNHGSQGHSVPLIALEDLIKLKKISGRSRDKTDIRALQTIQKIRHEKARKKA